MSSDPERIIRETMEEQPITPAVHLEFTIHRAFAELDEIMALAADPATKHLVIAERRAIHQLCSRAQLIASFVDAARDQPGKVRMVVNNA